MSARHPVFPIISDMEDDIHSVARWAAVLCDLGCKDEVSGAGVYAIGLALMNTANEIKDQWNTAFNAAKGGA